MYSYLTQLYQGVACEDSWPTSVKASGAYRIDGIIIFRGDVNVVKDPMTRRRVDLDLLLVASVLFGFRDRIIT